MRFLGSLLCWIMPERVFGVVAETGADARDFISLVLGTGIVYGLAFQLVSGSGAADGSGFLSSVLGGIIGIGAVNVVLCLGITWAFSVALSDHEVEGRKVDAGFSELLGCHLHAFAVFLTLVFVALVTRDSVVIALAVLAGLRTFDLEARVLRRIAGIPSGQAYKAALVLFAILIGTPAVLAFLFLR